jgi:hypothetical protein
MKPLYSLLVASLALTTNCAPPLSKDAPEGGIASSQAGIALDIRHLREVAEAYWDDEVPTDEHFITLDAWHDIESQLDPAVVDFLLSLEVDDREALRAQLTQTDRGELTKVLEAVLPYLAGSKLQDGALQEGQQALTGVEFTLIALAVLAVVATIGAEHCAEQYSRRLSQCDAQVAAILRTTASPGSGPRINCTVRDNRGDWCNYRCAPCCWVQGQPHNCFTPLP